MIRQELPYLKFTLLYIIIFLGARVDHGHHAGKAVRAVNDAVALAKAVDKAVSMVDKGALIFFTVHQNLFQCHVYTLIFQHDTLAMIYSVVIRQLTTKDS